LLAKCELPPYLRFLTYADFTIEADREVQLERLLLSIQEEQKFYSEIQGSRGSTSIELEVYKLAITRLLALQYPWGEWSDRRTTLESTIAERRAVRGLEGPKPNVARTLFAVEALDSMAIGSSPERCRSALTWRYPFRVSFAEKTFGTQLK
jgi:hypothetical protein